MAQPGVIVEQIWKKFHRGELHDSLRDLVPALARRVMTRGSAGTALDETEFWALRDVSFELGPGQALGVIGGNGAGKSTLLKLINRILRPTSGRLYVQGRVGALIEVSGGFHPDLTGRENVFLQGAIMGMRRREIARRFDEIVAFSGVEAFIDTPVKRYSNGMNARLGFAIAAHLEADVLLIDEILSVGDWSFQRKAFDRMKALVRSGIPVVVVSHQLDRIADLCDVVMLLHQGERVMMGRPDMCIAEYLRSDGPSSTAIGVRLTVERPPQTQPLRSGSEWSGIVAVPRAAGDERDLGIGVRLLSATTGHLLYRIDSSITQLSLPRHAECGITLTLQMNVPPGLYYLEPYAWDVERPSRIAHAGRTLLEVVEGVPFKGTVQCNGQLGLCKHRS